MVAAFFGSEAAAVVLVVPAAMVVLLSELHGEGRSRLCYVDTFDDLAGLGDGCDRAGEGDLLLQISPAGALFDFDEVLVAVLAEPCDELLVVRFRLEACGLADELAVQQSVGLGAGLGSLVLHGVEELLEHRGQERGVLLVSALGLLDLLLQASDLLLCEGGDAVELVPLGLDLLQSPVGAAVVGDAPALRRLLLVGICVPGKSEPFELLDGERSGVSLSCVFFDSGFTIYPTD